MSAPQWLLVEVLDDGHPFVVAVGETPRKRVALGSFIRSDDRSSALSAVREVRATNRAVTSSSRGRSVVAEPIADDVSGLVHGVWLRVGYGSPDTSRRPSAWAFTWDLATGRGRRSAIASEDQSWSSLGVQQTYSFAEGLDKLDLGSDTVGVLADVVAGVPGRVLQVRGVERRPDGDDRALQIVARFGRPGGSGAPCRGIVRGVSVDLGSATDVSESSSTGASVAEAVARSLRRPGEYRAVLDPETMVLLHWDGDAPELVQWQRTGLDADGAFVHPDDVEVVRSAARAVDEGPRDEVSSVRLRARDGLYKEVPATVHNVSLADAVDAILLVFHDRVAEQAR
ncbi:GAF domain-containing protein [Rhodococcus sp. 15-649-2-2]|uniref:GAF domain-containing protein n=1 Tax=Rhodococcus sp. 15-649-2-2 TaxID=2023140 RepID=UPI00117A354C|nr:GAF domain-containing protein [Rhodococcus sp. 15-649-2-2]